MVKQPNTKGVAQKKATTTAAPVDKFKSILMIAIPIVTIIIVAVVWILAAHFSGNDSDAGSSDVKPTPSATESPAPEPTDSPTTGKDSLRPSGTVDENRNKIASKAEKMLQQSRNIAGKDDFNKVLKEVANGNEKGLPKGFVKNIRTVDVMKNKDIHAAGVMSVLQLGNVLHKNVPTDQKIELLQKTAWSNVYVDMKAGNAFVPLSIFMGEKASFNLEYVWVDGEWVFMPYSFLDSISSANEALSNNQPPAKPNK